MRPVQLQAQLLALQRCCWRWPRFTEPHRHTAPICLRLTSTVWETVHQLQHHRSTLCMLQQPWRVAGAAGQSHYAEGWHQQGSVCACVCVNWLTDASPSTGGVSLPIVVFCKSDLWRLTALRTGRCQCRKMCREQLVTRPNPPRGNTRRQPWSRAAALRRWTAAAHGFRWLTGTGQ